MKKNELIDYLNKFKGNPDVAILDGFNGGGNKRKINLLAGLQTITKEDEESGADYCDSKGMKVIVLGYGCY